MLKEDNSNRMIHLTLLTRCDKGNKNWITSRELQPDVRAFMSCINRTQPTKHFT